MKSKAVAIHQPCPDICGQSSDAYSLYDDGHGYCHSCGRLFPAESAQKGTRTVEATTPLPQNFTLEYQPRRGLTKETHEFFRAKTRVAPDGQPVAVEYPFANGAKQVRRLSEKAFFAEGPISQASGWAIDRFTPGQSKSITITEGMDDAMSVWQMLGKYPVYAVKSASSALKDVRADYEALNAYERIYLCLDNDEPGQKATREIASVFGFNKVYHVKLAPHKDANDFLKAGKLTEFKNAWYNATRFLPEGVVSSFSEIDAILDNANKEPGHPWPFKTLNYLTDGIKRGRSYLLSGLEGIGKTEFFHAVEYHLAVSDPDANIGIIHLEEPTDENIKKLVSYKLKVPVLFNDSGVSNEEVKATYRSIAGREDRLHIYNHFGSDEPDILLSKIRFLVAAAGCKYIFLDNITIIATGRTQEDERKELDYLSTQLEMMVKELKFALIFISHENDSLGTRGSKNISKVCDVWINMTRDIKAEDEHTRNIQSLTIFKGRGCRGTGPAGRLFYDPATATLADYSEELPA